MSRAQRKRSTDFSSSCLREEASSSMTARSRTSLANIRTREAVFSSASAFCSNTFDAGFPIDTRDFKSLLPSFSSFSKLRTIRFTRLASPSGISLSGRLLAMRNLRNSAPGWRNLHSPTRPLVKPLSTRSMTILPFTEQANFPSSPRLTRIRFHSPGL